MKWNIRKIRNVAKRFPSEDFRWNYFTRDSLDSLQFFFIHSEHLRSWVTIKKWKFKFRMNLMGLQILPMETVTICALDFIWAKISFRALSTSIHIFFRIKTVHHSVGTCRTRSLLNRKKFMETSLHVNVLRTRKVCYIRHSSSILGVGHCDKKSHRFVAAEIQYANRLYGI